MLAVLAVLLCVVRRTVPGVLAGNVCGISSIMGKMTYVYILRSIRWPSKAYVGFTRNLKERFLKHNSGVCKHTCQFRPWVIETYIAFSDEKTARLFEKYLKSGSGTAFRNRWLG
jgi:predicted GIY-YIG superfamily endonuclease